MRFDFVPFVGDDKVRLPCCKFAFNAIPIRSSQRRYLKRLAGHVPESIRDLYTTPFEYSKRYQNLRAAHRVRLSIHL